MTKQTLTSFLTCAFFAAVLAPSAARAASTHDVEFDVAIAKKNVTKHFTGSFEFDAGSLSGVGKEVLREGTGLEALNFDFYGSDYTAGNTRGTRAVFVDGELVGVAFKFLHRNGKKYRVAFKRIEVLPTQKTIGAATPQQFVLSASSNQNLAAAAAQPIAGSIVSAPTPMAATGGLALLASMVFVRRPRREV